MAAITLQRTARDLTTQARRKSIPQGWGLPAAWQAFTIVTVDFETFFSADYTLKKLNTSDYIRDPRFRAHMASIKVGNTPTRLVLHKDLQKEFAKIDWSRTMLLCHNTSFDGLIMQHHYGVVPAVYLDTLSMARAVHGNAIRADLDTVARFYGRGNKMEDVLMQSRGIENLELPEHKELLLKMGAYCVVDSDLCYAVFHDMLAKLPPEELELIHQTISMFANPVLEINLPLAAEARDEEVARRELLFKKCIPDSDVAEWRENNRSKKDRELTDHQVRAKLLRKDVYFAAVLQEFGVAPPKKYSTKQEKMVVSFSKDLLVALQESIQPDAEDGEELHDLLQARIDANSTITVTRAERLLSLGKNGWKVPVGYNYYRAVTGRWGGANKCLAGTTRIKVLRASGSQHVYLSHLQDDDLVWDGTEYVAHDGLIFQGVRPVLSYGGIIGTPDHKVFVESNNDPVELHVAKQNGWALQKVEESHSQEYHCTSVPAVAVYDILNCGPRNRFSANGKLVSNCNFQNFSRGGKLRKSIQAQRGYQIVVVDSSQIEARTLAWVTGANWKLDVFRKYDIITGAKHGKTGETLELRGDPDSFILNLQAKDEKWEPTRAGPDNYRVAYATAFRTAIDAVTKDQRQVGKVCIAEDTPVLTDKGLVPIQHITPSHKVWDGVEWVTQEGAVFNGYKEVITYDGLTATPDHAVWVEGVAREIPFALASSCGARLTQSGAGGKALRVGNDNLSRTPLQQALEQLLCSGAMQWLRDGKVDFSFVLDAGEKQRLSTMLAAAQAAEVARQATYSSETTLHEPERQGVQELRCARSAVQVCERDRSRYMDSRESRTARPSDGTGPHGREQTLRAGEFALGYSPNQLHEPAPHAIDGVEPSRVAVCSDSSASLSGPWYDTRTDNATSRHGSTGETQELAAHCRKARVYDLLNCGPRHRFTAGNCLVHNCELALGYQGAVGAFNSMARNYGMKLPENEVKRVVHAWRRANKETVAFWAACEDVLRKLCKGLSGRFGRDNVLEYGVWGNIPQVKLPNGMTLKYPGLKCELSVDKYGRERMRCSYITAEGPKDIYGGLLCENITQALARIIVGYQSLELARKFRWVMTVHDEGSFHVPTPKARAFYLEALKVFRTPPSWAPDLPVNGDGGWDRSYCK